MEEKETKNKFWKGVLVGALVTAFGGLIAVGTAAGIWVVGHSVDLAVKNGATETEREAVPAGKLDMSKIGPKLLYMEQLADQYFLFNEDIGDEERKEALGEAEDWIYSGYIYSFGDPYSVYYNKEEFNSLTEENSGEYCGIGVQVSQNVYTGIIDVVKVFKDSPAEEAGMLPGDILYKVKDIDAASEDLSILVSDHIRGEEGTTVHLTVYRKSSDEYIEMDVERRMVENPTVEFEMLGSKTGYISISSFEEVTGDQFKAAVDALEGDNMKGLIVDLRNNGGGITEAAEQIADYLLPEGKKIVTFKGKGVPEKTFETEDGHQVNVPIVILANGNSASSSEVLIGALKDNEWATVVGEKTFGKGIAQGIFDLPDGSGLKLTTAYYYTPSGECIHETGIEPDVEVILKEELKSQITIPKDEDNQLQAALGIFTRGLDAVKEEAEAAAKERETATEALGVTEPDGKEAEGKEADDKEADGKEADGEKETGKETKPGAGE